jgi:hypothetical protein
LIHLYAFHIATVGIHQDTLRMPDLGERAASPWFISLAKYIQEIGSQQPLNRLRLGVPIPLGAGPSGAQSKIV